jgi:zinc transporter ZupT
MLYLLYAGLAALADFLPGFLYLRKHPTLPPEGQLPGWTRYLVAAASGIVVGAALFELLPEAGVEQNAAFVALGFFAFYLVEKLLMLHACGEAECDDRVHRISWLAAAGMASDNVMDGVGITIGYLTDPFLGLVLTLAVVSHEVPQGITTAVLGQRSGFSYRKSLALVAFAGLMYPAGSLLALALPPETFPPVLAVVAGVFLYVGAGDLLLEVHRKFNSRVILSVILGALLMFGVSRLHAG